MSNYSFKIELMCYNTDMVQPNPVNTILTHRLFPPRGIFIPNEIIFNTQLSPAVILTWIQLRCLAWDGGTTPPLSIPELASLLGIHPNRLNKHLYQLHGISALSCRSANHLQITLSFPEIPAPGADHLETTRHQVDTGILCAKDRETSAPQSYFPRQIMGYLSNQDDLDECSRPSDSQGLMVEQVEVENYIFHS